MTCFVPEWRKDPSNACRNHQTKDAGILQNLHENGLLEFTPCGIKDGQKWSSYDDG